MKLADREDYEASDYTFDYSASSFKLRRPVPCPAGLYCHAGRCIKSSLSIL
jgi:hypothetical protein